MNDREVSPSSMLLLRYVRMADHGFAIPCFATTEGANTFYLASASIPGDLNSEIENFEPYAAGCMEKVPAGKARPAEIGHPWLNVFLWNGDVLVGTAGEVWAELEQNRGEIETHAPLSLLSLAESAAPREIERLSSIVYEWIERRYGKNRAFGWRNEVYFRGLTVKTLREKLGPIAHTPLVRRLLQDVFINQIDSYLTVKLPAEICTMLPELWLGDFRRLHIAARSFDLHLGDIQSYEPDYYKNTSVAPSKYDLQTHIMKLATSVDMTFEEENAHKPDGRTFTIQENDRVVSHTDNTPLGILDIGTTKVVCIIGRVESDRLLRVLGFGWQRARGVRAGAIVDIEDAERAIRATVGQAEDTAGARLRDVTVNLSCGQPESRLFNVQWPVGGRAVTDQDLRRVLSEGRARAASEGREIIHALPLGFSVDDMQGVADPRGLHCETLTTRLHVVDAATTALRTLGAAVARCDLDIAELVSAPMAAGLATLVEDEKQLGATVLDMGGGTTGMAVFAEGQLLYTALLPLGGAYLTNDIARVLSTPVAHAERLKTLYGSAQSLPDDEREMLPVPLVGEEDERIAKVPRSMVVNIIRPRLEETFEMVRERLNSSGLGRIAGTRVVLTGGASQLSGAREMAARVLGRQVRAGRPAPLRGLPDAAGGPAFATAVGLLAWRSRGGQRLAEMDIGHSSIFQRIFGFIVKSR